MKKILTLLSILFVFALGAQTVSTMSLSASHFTNTTAVTATLQTKSVCENISLQAVVTKSTGTVDGYVSLAVSIDGINYITQSDSLDLTDVATQSKIWELTDNNYMYYKLIFQGAGTMDAVPVAKLFTSGATNAHATSNMLSEFSQVSDTTVNGGTTYLTLPVQNWYNSIAIQSVVTKISGTVDGEVTLQGSLDGTNFLTVDSNYSTVTSYNPTDVATSTKIFIVTGSPYRYYRLKYVGLGTMSASHRGYVLPNKK